ncbi:MAG TPA: ATP-dependent protease, partial [Alphaproteobacteria bacterium]|nr:ATP-dependent protease [Alphaproteobacteria bacterium]
ALAPVRNGEVLKPDTFEALPEVTRKGIEQDIQTLQQELQKIMEHMPRLEKERRRALRELNQEFANYAVKESIDEERAAFADLPEVLGYLDAVQADVIDNVHLFIMQSELRESTEFAGVSNETGDGGLVPEGSMPAMLGSSFRRYETNLIVDNSGAAGAPVVHEGKPSLAELVGRVEHLAQMGALVTDFTLIKP